MIDYNSIVKPLQEVSDTEGDLALFTLAGLLQNWAANFSDRANKIRADKFSQEQVKANASLPVSSTKGTV